MQNFTTPSLNTDRTNSLEYRVVTVERERMNNYLSEYFKDGCIALPVNKEVLKDLYAKDLRYLILRVAFYQPDGGQLVYAAIALVPPKIYTDKCEVKPVSSDTLIQLVQDITTTHDIKSFLYTRPGEISQLLDAQGTVQDELIAPTVERHVRHFHKLYDCDTFVECYMNEVPQGVSSAYMRRGELFQRVKVYD